LPKLNSFLPKGKQRHPRKYHNVVTGMQDKTRPAGQSHESARLSTGLRFEPETSQATRQTERQRRAAIPALIDAARYETSASGLCNQGTTFSRADKPDEN
jgi:hypothetical protein